MPDPLEELLLRWEEQSRNGQPMTVEELCRACPHLYEELRARVVALQQMNQMLDLSDAGPPDVTKDHLCADFAAFQAGAEPIAGYRLEKRLGRGGFGEVWQATGPGGFAVALKFVPLTGQLGLTELRSLEIIKRLRHPNLLALFGAWQVRGILVMAMELADGTLMDRLHQALANNESGIPYDELIRYMQEAARGIDYLNQPGDSATDSVKAAIQHRDIKPQNILLMGQGGKIGDFGLLRILKKTSTEHTGSLTLAYAAPEFFMGHVAQTSDQYSLAITYCQLRGGRLPFTGPPGKIMQGHIEGVPDLTMVPEAERQAVARALAKNPQERWPCCAAFINALIEASAQQKKPQPRRWIKARILGWAGSVVSAFLLLSAAIVWFGPNEQLEPGPKQSAATDAEQEKAHGGIRPPGEVIASPPKDIALVKSKDKGEKPKESEADALLRQGRNRLAQKNYALAFEMLTEALKQDPSLAWAHVERAEAAFNLKRFDQSIADCTDAMRLGPTDDKDLMWKAFMRRGHAVRSKSNLGKKKVDRGKINLAMQDYSAAIQIWPQNGHGYLWRGDAKRLMSDLDGSIADFGEAIRLAPPGDAFLLGSAHEWRGHSCREKGAAHANQAIADYTDSLKYRPDAGRVYYWRGVAHEVAGNADLARKDRKQAQLLGYSGK